MAAENERKVGTDEPHRGRRRKSAVLIYIFGVIGGINWGYDTGVISAALIFLREDFNLTSWAEGWVTTGLIIGAVIGAAFGGRLADRYGRWKVLLVTALFLLVAPPGMAWAPEEFTLFVFRFVAGLGAGLTAVILPVYLSEIAPARIRGKVTGLYALSIVTGQFLGFLVGMAFAPLESWRWMLGFSVVPSILFTIGLFFIWETPRWLVMKGRRDEAMRVLLHDRAPVEAEREHADICRTHEAEKASCGSPWKVLRQAWVRPILVIGISVAMFQQFMGINTIIYYAPTVLQNVGFEDEAAIAANLVIGVLNILAMWFALSYADRWGRKPLMLAGAAGTLLSLGILAATNLTQPAPDGFGVVGLVTLACIAAYVFLFQMSWGSMTWVVLGELFPLSVRGPAMALATTLLWVANGLVALSFPPLLEAVGVGRLFAGFSVICLAALLFTVRLLPETKGKSLEQIEATFRGTPGVRTAPGSRQVG
ncbi:sugar porter family MFS transporter [Nocardiopsis salina]|uniref:sugar porter family MFS transporter n=1 Tax=Nocardiopsis salina TaxID=245836 RepID=UPI00035D834E|nr:sugar porter family MFS transporter [Nocardiopsis salina]